MRLRSVQIRGFRSLKDAGITDLAAINTLVGRNNSGKSALLESILLSTTAPMNDVRLEAVQATLPWSRPVAQVVGDSISGLPDRGFIDLRFALELDEAKTRALFEGTKEGFLNRIKESGPVTLTYDVRLGHNEEKWSADQIAPVRVSATLGQVSLVLTNVGDDVPSPSGTYQLVEDWPPVAQALLGEGSGQFGRVRGGLDFRSALEALGGSAERREFAPLAQWIEAIRFVGRTRECDDTVELAQSELLRSDGSNLPRFFQHLANNSSQRWVELKALLGGIVPWLHDVYTPIDRTATATRVALNADQDVGDAFILANMGAGTTHLMTIVSMVWDTPDGGLCLIEEPEAGLHNSAQRDLALWLRRHAIERGKQLIIATHSPLFARPLDSDSVYLTTYDPIEGSKFRKVSDPDTAEIAKELGARMIDLFAFDCVLFLEGESEMVAVPIIADALGIDLALLGIRIQPLHGTGRLQRLRAYLEYLRDSQVLTYVMMDLDEGVGLATEKFIDEGLLAKDNVRLWTRSGDKAGEFEDNFSDSQLIEAANSLAEAGGSEASLQASDLEDLRKAKPDKMTSKLLRGLYYSHFEYVLDKPELAEKLAVMAAEDIRNGNRNYQLVRALEHLEEVVRSKT